jgi:putative acetyltransferase
MVEGLRLMRDEDAEAMIGIVGRSFAEYPGCVLDLPGIDADLPELPRRLRDAGGEGWVVVEDDLVVAMIGWAPVDEETGELKRLYIDASARRRGLGASLVGLVIEAVRSSGRARVELWSDTRFADAHRLYERMGFERQPETRDLHDPSNSTEYHYLLDLGKVTPPG